MPSISRGAAGLPPSQGRTVRTARCARIERRCGVGSCIGPSRQRSISPPIDPATSRRISRCSRSPASTLVEPRGGIASSSRTITLRSASRGSPRSRTKQPATASPSATGNSTTSAPRARIVPVSASGRGNAGRLVVTPRRFASGSNVDPWTIVERSTAKNTMLKYSWLCGTPSSTGNVASTTGTAPRRPAHPRASRSPAVKRSNAVATATATGRATSISTSARTVPSNATLSS